MQTSFLYTIGAVIVVIVLGMLAYYALAHGVHGRFVYVPRGGRGER
jgi:hypothetical protein